MEKHSLSLVFLVVVLLFFSCQKSQPTCFDHIQNGDEVNIDCGGDCPLSNCDSLITPPSNSIAPCASTVKNNVMEYGGLTKQLSYNMCQYISPTYQVRRTESSTFASSSNYISIYFYGNPPSYSKVYTSTGSSSNPSDADHIRLSVKLNGSIYYPTGNVYYSMESGNYTCILCNVKVGSEYIDAKITCN